MQVFTSFKITFLPTDGTIYDDGSNLEKDSPVLHLMMALLDAGFYVAIVTAGNHNPSLSLT
jgi:hypothetical protein